jgi:hypothetical protein
MDELGKWFLEAFSSVNKGGRLGPPVACQKRVEACLEEIGGEGVLKLSTILKIGNADEVRQLANRRPALGEQLREEDSQKVLEAYFAERKEIFEPYREFVARGLSLLKGYTTIGFVPGEPSSTGRDAWEKVFRLLTGGENDGKESSSL